MGRGRQAEGRKGHGEVARTPDRTGRRRGTKARGNVPRPRGRRGYQATKSKERVIRRPYEEAERKPSLIQGTREPREGPREEMQTGPARKRGSEREHPSPGHPGQLGKLQEEAGDYSRYGKGQGGGGTPWPSRNCKTTGKVQKAEEQHGPWNRYENLLGKVQLEEPTKEVKGRTKKNG